MTTETETTVKIDTSSAVALTTRAKSAFDGAGDIVIDSPEMLQLAGEELRSVKTLQKQVEEQRTSITKPLNDALRAVNALFKAPADFLDRAETKIKGSVLTYTAEQQRLAAIAQREADAKARAERERLAEEARKAQEESAKALADAQAASAVGDVEAEMAAVAKMAVADSVAQQAVITAEVLTFTPAVVAPEKVSGISGRVTYSAQVDDVMALVKSVAAGTTPIEAITPDIKFLGAQARAFKKPGPLYPGVTVIAERGISARAA